MKVSLLSFIRPPLIMVSVDGFRASYLKKGKSVIPNINKLSTSASVVTRDCATSLKHVHSYAVVIGTCGTSAPYMRPVYPSKTFPNLYTLATVRPPRPALLSAPNTHVSAALLCLQGLYPESHGIVGNTMHDPVFNATFSLRTREKLNHRWWGGQPVSNGPLTRLFEAEGTFM